MPARNLPVRPHLEQLRHQAKDLHRAIRAGEPDALADLAGWHPSPPEAAAVRLTDAQLVLARSYGAPSWPRLVLACRLIDAIWRDDLEEVRKIVGRHPKLIHEQALITSRNWGPPMSYAANLGRDRIIRLLHDRGATDHAHALDRAALQGQIGTARLLHGLMGAPPVPQDALGGPAYTLSASGTAFLLEMGVKVVADDGTPNAPADVVLETDSRKPAEKHAILEMYVSHGLRLPDTAPVALHRGRVDLLEEHLTRDPEMLRRTFRHEEIYPPEIGCHDEVLATHGTPLNGATLLHMAIDFDEMEIFRWLLDRGMDPDARAALDEEGFGGHTPLFSTVVSQPAFWMNFQKREQAAPYTGILLERGADPNRRASLRKQLHPGYGEDEQLQVYRDVTPLSWGRRFHRQIFVNQVALRLIEEAGGRE